MTRKLIVVKVRDGYYQDRESSEAYYSDDVVWVSAPLYRVIGPRGKIYKEFKTQHDAEEFAKEDV